MAEVVGYAYATNLDLSPKLVILEKGNSYDVLGFKITPEGSIVFCNSIRVIHQQAGELPFPVEVRKKWFRPIKTALPQTDQNEIQFMGPKYLSIIIRARI